MEKSSKVFGILEKDTAIKAALAIGVAAAVGGALYLMGKKEETTIGEPGQQITGNHSRETGSHKTAEPRSKEFHAPHVTSPTAHKMVMNNDSAMSVLANSVKNEHQMYSKKTLTQISEMLEDNCIDEFGSIVKKARDERRFVGRANLARYQQIVEQELVDTDQLLTETIMLILEKIGGDFEVYKNSIDYWSQRDQNFALLQMMMVEKMKIGIKSDRDRSKMTPAIAKDMMRYQIEVFPNLKIQVDNPELSMLVKKSILQDMIFEKFHFEEEDLVILPSLGMDPEFVQLAQQLQMLIQMDQMQAFSGMMGF